MCGRTESLRDVDGTGSRAICDGQPTDSPPRGGLERLQADPPGADDQNALFAEISQCRLCQCECHGAGRGRVRADRRLRACAPRGRDRGAEEECESWADGAFRSRGFERGTDLSEDLGLAEHQRVKAGGHAAEVARDVFGSVHVEMVEQDVTLHAVLRRESVQKLIAGVLDTRREPARRARRDNTSAEPRAPRRQGSAPPPHRALRCVHGARRVQSYGSGPDRRADPSPTHHSTRARLLRKRVRSCALPSPTAWYEPRGHPLDDRSCSGFPMASNLNTMIAGGILRAASGGVGVKKQVRLVTGLTRFLRGRVEPAEALELARDAIRARMRKREENFLAFATRAIFENPASPYLKLLEAKRIALSDVERWVSDAGIESALATLRDEGVYFTIDEYKGTVDVHRNGVRFRLDESDFDNPFLSTAYYVRTGATRSAGRRVRIDFDYLVQRSSYDAMLLHLHDALTAPVANWFPVFPGCARHQCLASLRADRQSAA